MLSNQKPPMGSVLDLSNPLMKNLMGCWLLNELSGCSIFNLANNVFTTSSTYTAWKDSRGLAKGLTDRPLSQSAQTFFVKFRTGSGVTTAQCLMGHGGQYVNSGDFSTLGLRIKNSALRGCVGIGYNNWDWFNNCTIGISANTDYSAAFVLEGWNNPTMGHLYLNGALRSSYSGNVGTYSSNFALTLGTSNANETSFVGTIISAMYWHRALSADEIRQLHEMTAGW